MKELRRIEQDILAKGFVDSNHLVSLRLKLYSGGAVGLAAADFLVELHKHVQHNNPAFEHLYYRAMKDHVLVNGRIEAVETAWLRPVLFADGDIKDEERKWLHELKDEAENACCEFDALFAEAIEMPLELHTTDDARPTLPGDLLAAI